MKIMRKTAKSIWVMILITCILLAESRCVYAENKTYTPFAVGQTLSGTLEEATDYYTVTLPRRSTVRFRASMPDCWVIYVNSSANKSLYSIYSNHYTYNAISGLYTVDRYVTLDAGTYLIEIKNYDNEYAGSYSVSTSLYDNQVVTGTADPYGNISIGLKVKRGKSLQLTSVLSGLYGKTKWKSSKKSVVSVNAKGKLKARRKGTAYVTATCNGKKTKIKVKVY